MSDRARRWALVAMLAVCAIGVVAFSIHRKSALLARRPVAATEMASIGGPFTLVDQTGRTVSEHTFRGKLLLVHFGYTYSPDVCPSALTTMADALRLLGDDGVLVVPVFITVDPQRDTPEQLTMYVRHFHPRLLGLTGTAEQVAVAAHAFQVHFGRVAGQNGDAEDYLMDHTAIIYLMGRDGGFRAHFTVGTPAAEIAERIREYL